MIQRCSGLYHCPLGQAYKLMPELTEILDEAPIEAHEYYVVDVKIHMLMPGQWPCIPNWHHDNVPRNEKGEKDYTKVDLSKKMLLWVSGEPLTEFRGSGIIEPREWHSFDQADEHRGHMSKIHTWRTFIRLTPEPLLIPAEPHQWLRTHSQVYLDVNKFEW